MKRQTNFLILLIVGILMAFVSCENNFVNDFESSSDLRENEKAIVSLDRCAQMKEDFMPLNVIPKWAKERMTSEEYEMWLFVGSMYKVNYSFLLSPDYEENRPQINAHVKDFCNQVKEGLISEEEFGGWYIVGNFTSQAYQNVEYGIEQLSDPESTVDKIYSETIYIYGDVSLTCHVIYNKLSSEYLVRSTSFIAYPSDAKYEGASSVRITPDGWIHISCSGRILCRGKIYPVSETFVDVLSESN